MAQLHLDSLADYMATKVLKEDCKNCKVGTLQLEVVGNCEKYIDKRIPIIFSIAYSLFTIQPYV